MSKKKTPHIQAHIIKAQQPLQKAEHTTQLDKEDTFAASEWLEPPSPLGGLKNMVDHSSILPQCIQAYKNNIAGFGIGVRYKEDYKGDETPEMEAEFDKATEVIELLNTEKDTKEIFEDIIGSYETYGVAYCEVIRNNAGEVAQIDFIRDTPSVRKTKPIGEYQDVTYNYKGKPITRKKRFRKYRQNIGSKAVYFKEFGDLRHMDVETGEYVKKIPVRKRANEILEFAIGTEPYGEVRWLGQILGVDGSRKAESLNNRYFEEGRHTPMMIMIKNGTLTDDSYSKLQQYMNDIKGENGQHAFMLLEAEGKESGVGFDPDTKPEIDVKDMASILQKDELFQNYLDNSRRKVQSAFRLPDLYVGYTTDFNRSTANTAQEVTEKQVFQPLRRSLAWKINNKLLNGYGFKYVEAYFKEPDITDPDDIAKILNITERAGGLTPNKARDITYKVYGESAEDYEVFDGELPLQLVKAAAVPSDMPSLDSLGLKLTKQIKKAEDNDDMVVVAAMKEIRSLLMSAQGVDAK